MALRREEPTPSGAQAMSTLRALAAPFVVAPPTGQHIRARLHLTDSEVTVMSEVGAFLGSLAGPDLAARCALGSGSKHLGRKERKRGLTAAISSRWAGSITSATDEQWQLALDNLYRYRQQLREAIAPASWIVAPDGNPIGSPIRIELALTGASSRRDGLLRAAITQLLDVAKVSGCSSLTIENLNFASAI